MEHLKFDFNTTVNVNEIVEHSVVSKPRIEGRKCDLFARRITNYRTGKEFDKEYLSCSVEEDDVWLVDFNYNLKYKGLSEGKKPTADVVHIRYTEDISHRYDKRFDFYLLVTFDKDGIFFEPFTSLYKAWKASLK
jgi:hypothetical protein